ncbi:MAG: hypothetical protein PVJ67_06185 [Candidatus Pacearchaeota archaeon]|jgi:hypothetical protein
MKKIITLLLLLLVLPTIFAININVEKTSSDEVMIYGIDYPVTFDLEIKNFGQADDFGFYNLVGFNMFPIGTTHINSGETKKVELKISPIGELNKHGLYTFQYFIRGNDKTEKQEELTFRIIDLEDAFSVGSGNLDANSNSIEIYIKNKVNFNFNDMDAKFSSAFFDLEENFDLAPYEEKTFTVELNNEDFKKLQAGFYTLKSDVTVGSETANVEGIIQFNENPNLVTTTKDYGFFINTKIVTKTNAGNTLEKTESVVTKNIVSRLFTTFSPEPDTVERTGTKVTYTWAKEIKPGENLEITTKTNWVFPIVVILLIITSTLLMKRYLNTKLNLRKKVTFVRTKGGEFALKVTLMIHSKSYVERVNIVDRLPNLVKIHERFGGEQPSRIDEKTKRIEWNFEKLEAGERRIISYIIYSKVGVVGKFALPTATAIYEKEGKIKESESNQAFFVSEVRENKREEGE